jgi:signal transduction histidine kinase
VSGRGPSRWTLQTRLTLGFAAVFTLAGAVVVLVAYLVVQDSLRSPVPAFAVDLAEHGLAGQVDASALESLREEVVAAFAQQRAQTLSTLLLQTTFALLGLMVLATILGWLLAGRTMRPLRQVTETASRVTGSSLHERIGLTEGSPEVQDLAASIDLMLARLDRSFDAQSRFVANASHELRTPLAIQRTLLEVETTDPTASADLQRVGGQLLRINERHERLVEDLLTLARGESPVLEDDRVDLADLVGHALDLLDHRGVEVSTDLRPAQVVGSAGLLDRLVLNLVGNALQHNVAGGWARVSTSSGPAGATLVVVNSGPVPAPHEVPALLRPFSRGRDRVGPGHGLGLSIAQAVVLGHGGTMALEPRSGGGLLVRVGLPAAPRA